MIEIFEFLDDEVVFREILFTLVLTCIVLHGFEYRSQICQWVRRFFVDDLVWDESLEIPQKDTDKFLGESEAVCEARQRLLQGLHIDPKLLNGQMSVPPVTHGDVIKPE